MQNTEIIERFEHYLKDEKNVSANTLSSYMRDIRQLAAYLDTHTETDIVSADAETLAEYVLWQRESGKSVATVSRSIASMKSLYSYLFIQQIITANPATKLVTDKNTERLPQILTSREVELLLEQPRCVDAKGYRDRAMLELLYATGMRVTELIDLDIGDVNLGAGVVRCHSRNKERVIPMYPAAIKALEDYITLVRPQMIAVPDEPSLFVNVSGDRMSRQGFWKIIKYYQKKANIAPFLRRASARKRRRYPRDPGDAGSCGHLLHAGVLAPCEKAAQGRIQQGPSQSLKQGLSTTGALWAPVLC